MDEHTDSVYRQAAIDALKIAYWDSDIQSAKDDPCIIDAMTDWAIRQVKALPSAQPERKKGKWINDKGLYKCSSCNRLWTEWWVLSKPIERMRKECPYCPMCGSYNGEEK